MKYFIQKPSVTRKSFAIKAYTSSGHRIKQYHQLPTYLKNSLDKINKGMHKGLYTPDQALAVIKELISIKSQSSDVNEKLFKSYWKSEYESRSLDDPRAMELKLRKALRLIGDLNLQLASASEIMTKLKETTKSISEMRYAIDRLNQLLKYLGKGFVLKKPRPAYSKVSYVTQQELTVLLDKFTDPILIDMAWSLFGTGCRNSEILALTERDYDKRNDTIIVDKQLTRDGLKQPKRGKGGSVFVLPQATEHLKRWLKVQDKEQYRYSLYPLLAPHGISPHDLRHSHAIHLIEKGCNLTEVAMQLRNSITVCQMYYVGFQHTTGTINRIKSILDSDDHE